MSSVIHPQKWWCDMYSPSLLLPLTYPPPSSPLLFLLPTRRTLTLQCLLILQDAASKDQTLLGNYKLLPLLSKVLLQLEEEGARS